MLQSGTGLGKAQSLQSGNVDVIARSPKQRNEAIHGTLVRPHATRRVIMRHKLHLSAVIAMSLMTVSSAAFAQAPGGGGTGAAQQAGGSTPPPAATPTNPGSAGISAAPGGQSSSTTGMGTGGTATTNPIPAPARHAQHIARCNRDRSVAERHPGRRCHSVRFFRAHRTVEEACRVKQGGDQFAASLLWNSRYRPRLPPRNSWRRGQ